MAESRVRESANMVWASSMGDGGATLVDHSEESANGLHGDDRVKEEEIEDIEEEDPIDHDFVARYGDQRAPHRNLNEMEMLNNIMTVNNQPARGMSSLITSTTPLDLASLLHASAQGESGEVHSCSPNRGKRATKRESSQGSSEAPDSKRRASNREAANRYREKKKQEMEVMRISEEALVVRNAELRQKEMELMEEIRQTREKMTNTFGFAPPFHHEMPMLDFSPCLILPLTDKMPKRIPFPKGLSPAEQNRESVRRDREKKKARFESLKAEEAILTMSSGMLAQQVNQLEAEIREMKDRMRSVGLIVPETSQVY